MDSPCRTYVVVSPSRSSRVKEPSASVVAAAVENGENSGGVKGAWRLSGLRARSKDSEAPDRGEPSACNTCP
jgi:hypothetical protein